MARRARSRGSQPLARRCLVIERHDWETGAYGHQLQFPLQAAGTFFGPDASDIIVRIRIFDPADDPAPVFEADLTVSRRYGQSATRRTNRVREIGVIPRSFIFFEETDQPAVYDIWWDIDMGIVGAAFHPWHQARSNQHGRGRLWLIVPAPVPRIITRV